MNYRKEIIPVYERIGKRQKLTGYLGELYDGETMIHAQEYSTFSQAEVELDRLMFDLLRAAPAEATAEPASTCCFCHKPHHPQDCPEMRALLFAPDAPAPTRCATCGDDGDCPDCDPICALCECNPCECERTYTFAPVIHQRDLIYPPIDVEFAPIGPEV